MPIQRGGRRGGRGQGQGRGGPNLVMEMDAGYRGGASNRLNHGGSGFGSRGGFVQRSVTREQQSQPQQYQAGVQYPGRTRNAVAASSAASTSSTKIVITKEMEDEILALNNEYLHTQDSEFRCIMEKASQAAIYCYKLGDGEGWVSKQILTRTILS